MCHYYSKFIRMYETNAPLIPSFKLKLKNNDLWRYVREILIISFLRFLFIYFRHTIITSKFIVADHYSICVHLPEIMWNRKTSPIWSLSLRKSQEIVHCTIKVNHVCVFLYRHWRHVPETQPSGSFISESYKNRTINDNSKDDLVTIL